MEMGQLRENFKKYVYRRAEIFVFGSGVSSIDHSRKKNNANNPKLAFGLVGETWQDQVIEKLSLLLTYTRSKNKENAMLQS